jgi:predicted nucleic acid-binding protein
LIWNLRGNEKAADFLDANPGFSISAVTYMELAQGVRNKDEFRLLRAALWFWQTTIVHISEPISARASYLVEQHALSAGLQVAEALIAATALDGGLVLISGNEKHYRKIQGLSLQKFVA